MAQIIGSIVQATWENGQKRPVLVVAGVDDTHADVVFFLYPEDGRGGGAVFGYAQEVEALEASAPVTVQAPS
jgi:hypothetical protein